MSLTEQQAAQFIACYKQAIIQPKDIQKSHCVNLQELNTSFPDFAMFNALLIKINNELKKENSTFLTENSYVGSCGHIIGKEVQNPEIVTSFEARAVNGVPIDTIVIYHDNNNTLSGYYTYNYFTHTLYEIEATPKEIEPLTAAVDYATLKNIMHDICEFNDFSIGNVGMAEPGEL